jgi:bifunctional lysine-specific demethylase and histidyl-hydroxylase NO66
MTTNPSISISTSNFSEAATITRWQWLSRCVSDPEDFLASCWATQPYLEAGAESRFSDILSLEELDRLLAMGTIRNSPGHIQRVSMIRQGKQMPPDAFTRDSQIGPSLAVDCERIAGLLRMGGTVVVRSVDEMTPGLFHLCGGLENELIQPVFANVYLTPPQTHGFTAHYDPHDVFILQISGRKHWRVFDPVPHAFGASAIVDIDPVAHPVVETVLTPGDVLYIPRGWVHIADTADDVSLHVTVSIRLASARDLLMHALNDPAVGERLDRALPTGSPENVLPLGSELADISQFLASAFNDPDTARAATADFSRLRREKLKRNTPGLIAGAIEGLRQKASTKLVSLHGH